MGLEATDVCPNCEKKHGNPEQSEKSLQLFSTRDAKKMFKPNQLNQLHIIIRKDTARSSRGIHWLQMTRWSYQNVICVAQM